MTTTTGAASELLHQPWKLYPNVKRLIVEHAANRWRLALTDMEAEELTAIIVNHPTSEVRAQRVAATIPATVTEGAQREAVAEFVAFCADINHAYTFTDWSTFYRLRNNAIDELELSRLRSAPPPPDRAQPERVEAIGQREQETIDALAVMHNAAVSFSDKYAACNARLHRECDDVDKVCAAFGIGVEQSRTEGGSLRPAHIVELIRDRLAPPNDASGWVTEKIMDMIRDFAECACDRCMRKKDEIQAILEAADRARKPGEEGVDESRLKEAYDDGASKMTTPIPGAASELQVFTEKVQMQPDTDTVVRHVYRTSEDSRRQTNFYEVNPHAARVLIAALTPPAPVTEGAQREAVALRGCLVYLIERGSPAEYWAGGSNNNWTSDACEARCYEHEAEAEYVHGGQLGEVRICAHMFNHIFDEYGRCERCRKNKDELVAPPPPDRVQPERVEADAVAWMVEASNGKWYAGKGVFDCTADPNAAVRYPSREAAEHYIASIHPSHREGLSATEHRWIGVPAPPNGASGGVTEAMVEAACIAANGHAWWDSGAGTGEKEACRVCARKMLEAADRARFRRACAVNGRSNASCSNSPIVRSAVVVEGERNE